MLFDSYRDLSLDLHGTCSKRFLGIIKILSRKSALERPRQESPDIVIFRIKFLRRSSSKEVDQSQT